MGGREKRNEDKDGIMTRVKACEEKTPDRSSSIFAGFSQSLFVLKSLRSCEIRLQLKTETDSACWEILVSK